MEYVELIIVLSGTGLKTCMEALSTSVLWQSGVPQIVFRSAAEILGGTFFNRKTWRFEEHGVPGQG